MTKNQDSPAKCLNRGGSRGIFKIGFYGLFFYNLVILIKLCKTLYVS